MSGAYEEVFLLDFQVALKKIFLDFVSVNLEYNDDLLLVQLFLDLKF